MTRFRHQRPVVERSPHPLARLLGVGAEDVAGPRIEQAGRRRAADVERDGRERALELPVTRVKAERDQLIPEREVEQRFWTDRAALVLVDERDRPEILLVRLVAYRGAAAKRVERVHRLGRLPRLALEAEREVRA